MRSQDKPVFAEAARHFDAWILVRRTNPDSLKYIGLPGYTPKRIECKAKTADCDVKHFRLAGLVVDPTLQPKAFSFNRKAEADEAWKKFTEEQRLSGPAAQYGVQTDVSSLHYGCVTFQQQYIHGDYDLYDIILTKHSRGNLAAVETLRGQPHMRGVAVNPVREYINQRIGVEMIQHGGEMQYNDHSEQSVDAFGPNGEQCTILNEYSLREWYRTKFEGRQPIEIPKR